MPTPTSYYTTCSPIIEGCKLYLDSFFTTYAPAGYYSDGTSVYQVTGSLGTVTKVTSCPSSLPCSGDCCFVGNTKVLLSTGEEKLIKDIIVGEFVLCFNEDTKENQIKKVSGLKTKLSNEIIKYTFGNGVTIECTKDHPIYVNNYKIASLDPLVTTEKYNFDIDIDLIKVGDIVHLFDGDTTYIEEIDEAYSTESVYTLEVEDNHNFYANGILVHNKSLGPICCFNEVTNQYLTITNAGDPDHPGCCCLGPNWVAANPDDCNLPT